MKTLLIVDMQNDFIPGGALPVPRGDAVIPVINRIQHNFDLIVATQDWHPPNHMSFASNHPGSRPFDVMEWRGSKQTLWPDHCVQGTPGAEFHSQLETRRIEAIFRKGTDPAMDSYSGFYDNGHLKRTGLSGYLRDRGCHEIHFCGLAADICVYYSIKDSLVEGFSAVLIEDATAPLDIDHFRQLKEKLLGPKVSFILSMDQTLYIK